MNNKGIDYFSFLMLVFGVMTLVTLIIFLTAGHGRLSDQAMGGVGGRAVFIFDAYQDAENALSYLDSAVRVAGRESIVEFGQSGFEENRCDVANNYISGEYALWMRHEDQCSARPPEQHVCIPQDISALKEVFANNLQQLIARYNSEATTKLPTEYQDITFADNGNSVTITGISLTPIIVTKDNLEYKKEVAFHEELPVDIINSFNAIIAEAERLTADTSQIQSGEEEQGNLRWNIVVEAAQKTCDSGIPCSYDCTQELDEECAATASDPDQCYGPVVCKDGFREYINKHYVAKITITQLDEQWEVGYLTESGKRLYEYKFALDWIYDVQTECR